MRSVALVISTTALAAMVAPTATALDPGTAAWLQGAAFKPPLAFNVSKAGKLPTITPGVGTVKPAVRIANLTATFVDGLKQDLALWKDDALSEVEAAKERAAAKLAALKNGTLPPSKSEAALAAHKQAAIDAVHAYVADLLDKKAGGFKTDAVASVVAKVNETATAWNSAADGGVKAQVAAAKLTMAAFAIAKTECRLRAKINEARALGVLPLPLSPTEMYVPGGGTTPGSTTTRRRLHALLEAGGPTRRRRGRALAQAAADLAAAVAELPAQPLPPCCATAGPSVDNALKQTEANMKDVQFRWNVGSPPTLQPWEIRSAARGLLFQCLPSINLENPSQNLDNVALVMRIMPQSLFVKLTPKLYAQNGPSSTFGRYNGDPAPSGPIEVAEARDSAVMYTVFLQHVGRLPFFCGEQGLYNDASGAGVYHTLEATCRRELAAFFGNAAQETGAGETDIPKVLQAFGYSREQNCWANQCGGYNPWPQNSTRIGDTCGAGVDCGEKVNYYGRGYHQTSYWYNYWSFGQTSMPTAPQLYVQDPDLLGMDPKAAMLSAILYTMIALPPKPSIHEIITGIYVPTDRTYAATHSQTLTCAGTVNIISSPVTSGTVRNQFMTAISAINGGVECRNSPPVPQAVSRTSYYIGMLEYFGVPPPAYTPDETTYLTPGAGCNICFGDPFSLTVGTTKPVGWTPRILLSLNCRYDGCKGTFDPVTGAPNQCVLSNEQDTFVNELTYAPNAATCQAPPFNGCKCGTEWTAASISPTPAPACKCCTFARPFLANTPNAAQLCKNIVSKMKWRSGA